ncbi:hypothetical protein IFM89_011434 [Coptis chinensis]|uniref:C2H2-type domain-containing protein n=1 Tax=Coptis chinensis TaxID=261450 RepID=A0A835IVQ2_9MAGN|nr:hypothetical protein IFM89_011434 [Coptis chinensis]
MENEVKKTRSTPVIFRDIRRYYCDYCGVSRSKKCLLTSHLLSNHKEEMERAKLECGEEEKEGTKSITCEECGASFRKPAYLKEHMRSHSNEVYLYSNYCFKISKTNFLVGGPPVKLLQGSLFHVLSITKSFACPINDCKSSYRRKDHLTRHLLKHEGKLFSCPIEGCNHRFAYQGNIKRHVAELHDEAESTSCDIGCSKQYVCQEIGCGKAFRHPSRLKKHEETHDKLDSVEAICSEPGCMKSFSNVDCLKAHLQSCHRHIQCGVCGTQQLRKNIKRHMRTHEAGTAGCTLEQFKCHIDDCCHTFTSKSNLNQHIKAVHLELRPYTCRFTRCGKKFPFKHVRDNHEKTGEHVYIQGDFEEADEQFRSRPRGGRKRKCPTVETLLRKRVRPPGQEDSALSHGSEYLAWLLSAADE